MELDPDGADAAGVAFAAGAIVVGGTSPVERTRLATLAAVDVAFAAGDCSDEAFTPAGNSMA